ncbi:MAG: ABC transporter permease subunit [Limnochordales bacterium]
MHAGQRSLRIWSWLFAAPALLLLGFYLVYPALHTTYLSFLDRRLENFVGFENYVRLFTTEATRTAIRNNLLWLVTFTVFSVGIGLLMAVLTDRVRYEKVARSIMFMPMAISFAGAGVIWKFMYAYMPAGAQQIGLLNAIVVALGGEPIAWLTERPWINNFALIAVGVWIWAGFCMVILSAAYKGIPRELLEAARVDGANEWQVFWRVSLPCILPTVVVVATTMVINVLKIFDVIYVMTNGSFGTEVLANRMYKEMFQFRNPHMASAIAVVLFVAVLPAMIMNVRRLREESGPGEPRPSLFERLRDRRRRRLEVAPAAEGSRPILNVRASRAAAAEMAAATEASRREGTAPARPRRNVPPVFAKLGRVLSHSLVHVVVIAVCLAWILPTLGLLVSSFRPAADVARSGWWTVLADPFNPANYTLDNYRHVLSAQGMWRAFRDSFLITVPSTLLPMAIAALAAFAFAWLPMRGRGTWFALVVALLVVPLQMTLIPILRIYSNVGLAGTLPGIWLAHTGYGLPFAIYLLRNFFASLPRDLFEAAAIDGASPLGMFFRLALPMSVPALASLGIFQFLWVWNDLLVALIYLGGTGGPAPLTLKLSSLVGSFGQQWHVLTAAAFVTMIVPLIVFFALQRYFVRGILAGAVKG